MKLRTLQAKVFNALLATDLELAMNTWFATLEEGELVSVELVSHTEEDENQVPQDYLVATVIYTTG